MKKVRVVHIFNEINFSGAEVMYAQAAPLFQDRGFELIAVSTGMNVGNYVEQFQKVHYKIFHKPLILRIGTVPQFILYFVSFYRFLKKEQIKVLHIHRSSHYWFFALCGHLAGTRSIRTVHSVFKNRKITWFKAYLERLTARKIFRLTFHTIGESVYKNELNYYRNRSVRINNWFDPSKFFPAEDDAEKLHARQQLGINESEFVIISTGSCSALKNHSDIIRALAVALNHFDCTYLHVGTGKLEGDERILACALGVQNKIHFVGNTEEVRQYLIASDVYVMTSKYEGLSIAAIEAMACKLPSVLYDVLGLKDLINNADNGLLITPSYEDLVNALVVLEGDSVLRKRMGENACRFANSYFNLRDGVNQIVELYKAQPSAKQ